MIEKLPRWLDGEVPSDLRGIVASAREDEPSTDQLAHLEGRLQTELGPEWSGGPDGAAGAAHAGSSVSPATAMHAATAGKTFGLMAGAAVVLLGAAAVWLGSRDDFAREDAPREDVAQAAGASAAGHGESHRAEGRQAVPLRSTAEPARVGAARSTERADASSQPDAVSGEARPSRPAAVGGPGAEAARPSARTARGPAGHVPRAASAGAHAGPRRAAPPAGARTPPADGRAFTRKPASADRVAASLDEAPRGRLAEELRQLEAIRRMLPGAPAAALEATERHARQFADGALGPERELLQLESLLRLGRAREAQELAARVRVDAHPYRAQIQQLLAADPANRPPSERRP